MVGHHSRRAAGHQPCRRQVARRALSSVSGTPLFQAVFNSLIDVAITRRPGTGKILDPDFLVSMTDNAAPRKTTRRGRLIHGEKEDESMAEHLSPNALHELEHTMRQRHENLRNIVHRALMESEENRYQALAGRVHDPGEESVADLITDLNFHRIDDLAEQLYAIESAISRMRNGSYGICAECGSEISVERLRAVPTALRCIECQAKYENEHGMARMPTL
jgi:RNA polymerase-binding protein DksA